MDFIAASLDGDRGLEKIWPRAWQNFMEIFKLDSFSLNATMSPP